MPDTRTVIAPPVGVRKTMFQNGDTGDIIDVIMYADRQSARYVRPGVEQLRGRDDYQTLCNIYHYIRSGVSYRPDPAGRERVQSPGAMMQSGEADCKSMSVAVGALCRALRIPYKYRFIAQNGAPKVHHVYVVARTPDGSAGGKVVVDAVNRRFDTEFPYSRRIDLKPGQQVPAGIGGIQVPKGTWALAALFGIWFLFAKKVK